MSNVPQDLDQKYSTEKHYFPDGSYHCVKCGASISEARDPSIPCVSVIPMAVMA